MSTNPFRRSSLKGSSGISGGNENFPIASAPIDIPDRSSNTPTPLSVNTKVPGTNQKHVNFASPPAIPISPVSYPPSPESTRFSPVYTFAKPVPPLPTDYSSAIQIDPFQAESGTDENDVAIVQALENAKVNTTLAAPTLEVSSQDAVKNTLSRFASAPKKPPATTSRDAAASQTAASHRQTMDVDAFKRLLLTGDSGQSLRQESSGASTSYPASATFNDSSSNTDTASISQRSLFDQTPTNDDSPRSSDDMDMIQADAIRQSLTPSAMVEGRKKPPPPAPRHGRPIKEDSVSASSLETGASQDTVALSKPRNPPAPPLARRQSQNSGLVRPSSSRQSSSSEVNQNIRSSDGSPRPPPPSKPRQPASIRERNSSSDLSVTMEEADFDAPSTTATRKSSDNKPLPPPARNATKRASMGTMSPPPLPPPRRGRASSRSSVESQRLPVPTGVASGGSENTSRESLQPEADSRRVSGSSSVNDILADLAALQREVDEARRKADG